MKSSYRLLATLLVAFASALASAQSFTHVTATNVGINGGQLCFTGTDANDNPVTYTAADGSSTSEPVCGTVANGSLVAALLVANTATATPANLSYRVTLSAGQSVYLTIRGVKVSGATWDFGSYVLPANGLALGFGTPTLACSAGAQYVSTDQSPSNWVCASAGATATVWQSYPDQPFCPAGAAYVTPKKGAAFCIATQYSGEGAPGGACGNNAMYFQQDAGNAFLWSCVNGVWTHLVSGEGTVTSVGIAVGPQMTVSGSPITGSGTITLGVNTTGDATKVVTSSAAGNAGDCSSWDAKGNLGSAGGPCFVSQVEPANTVFAAPDGIDGLPSFRHIVVHDLPFSYSGSTTELATVSGDLISGSVAAVGANGNLVDADTSTYFPGYLNASQVHGLAPSATIDTTNADNITSGTLNAARLPGSTFACPTGQVVSGFTLNDNTHPVCSTAGGTVSVGDVGAIPYYSGTPSGATIAPDSVAKTDGNGNMVATSVQLVTNGTGALTINSLGGDNAGCLYTDSAGNVVSTKNGCGVNGTVTSVGLDMPDIFSVSNSPITSSGVITTVLNPQQAQSFLIGPVQGNDASPSFRRMELTDIPASPRDLSGSLVFAGPVQASTEPSPLGYYAPRWRNIVAGDFGQTIGANLFLAGPTGGTSNQIPSWRKLTTADMPTTIINGIPTTCSADYAATGIDAQGNAVGCFQVAGGSVLSVGLSLPNIFSVSGSPVTTTGTLSATLSTQNGNLIFASPNGTSGTPVFRSLTAADLPASFNAPTATALASAPTQCPTGLLASGIDAQGNANCTNAGVVSSVGLTLPSIFTVSGSPVTTSGTLSATLHSQAAHAVLAGPATGSAGAPPAFRALTTADLPSTLFQNAPAVCASGNYAQGIDAQGNAICAAAGSVTSVGLSLPNIFTVSGSPVTSSGTLTATLSSQAGNVVLASPNGSAGAPAFRSLTTPDLPSVIDPAQFHLMYGDPGCSVPSESSGYAMTAFGCNLNGSYADQLSGIAFAVVPTQDNGNANRSASGFRFYNVHNPANASFTSAIMANDVQTQGQADKDNLNFYTGGATLTATIPTTGGIVNPASGVFGWQAGSNAVTSQDGSPDTALSRCGTDCVAVGNGSQGDGTATVQLGGLNFGSSAGTLAPSAGKLVLAPASGVVFNVAGDETVTGATILNGTLSVASTSNLNATNFGANASLLALNQATSVQNYGSSALQFKGSFYDGSQASDALWTIQNKLGSGTTPTQTLDFTASGSSGAAAISVPGLILGSLNGCLTATNGLVSSTGVACGSASGSGGGGGTVTNVSVANLSPLFTSAVDTPTTSPSISFSLVDAPAHKFFGNNQSGSATPDYVSITNADLPVISASNLPSDVAYTDVANTFTAAQTFSGNAVFSGNLSVSGLTAGRCVQTGAGGQLTTTSVACQNGTVTSVGVSVPSQMTVTGSPVTASGTIALGLNTLGTGTKVATGTTVGTAGHLVTWTSSGDLGDGGSVPTVTSVGLTGPGGIFSVSGSPVTTSGTLGLSVSGSSGGIPYFSSASTLSSSGAMTAHGVMIGEGAGNSPSSTGTGTAGQCLISNGSSADPTFQNCALVSSVGLSMPSIFSVSGSPVTSSGTLTASLAAEPVNAVWAGPSSGTTAALPAFRSLVAADIPNQFRTAAPTTCSSGFGIGIDVTGNAVCAYASFTAYTLNTTANPQNVALGDFNGDGYVDAAILNYTAGTVSIFFNVGGSGNYALHSTVTLSASLQDVAVGDVNNDGNLDLVVSRNSTGANSYYVLLGDGTGGFTATGYNGGNNPQTPILYDFNGDGKLDMAIANLNVGTVTVYQGNGDGTFSLTQTITVGSSAAGLVVGDWNQDGKADLAVNNTGAGSVSVILGSGTLTGFTVSQTVTGLGTALQGGTIVASNFYGHSYADLALMCGTSTSICILQNNGAGVFSLTQTITGQSFSAASAPAHWAVADFNGDGFVDLVVAQTGGSSVSFFLNSGSGTLSLRKSVVVGSKPNCIQTALINSGDSLPDLFVINNSSATASILINGAPPAGSVSSVALALPSIFSVTGSPVTGTGTLSATFISEAANSIFAAPSGTAGVPGFRLLTTTDLPLAIQNTVSSQSQNLIYASPSNSSGIPVFRPLSTADLPSSLFSTIPSSCISGFAIGINVNGAAVCSANGFTSTSYLAPANPLQIAIGDLNEDGRPDFVIFADPSSTVANVYLNGGSGYFALASSIPLGAAISGVAIADVNGDGHKDIVATRNINSTTNTYSVLIGNGLGGFTINNGNGHSAYMNGVALLDVNGDGRPDLVSASGPANSVDVYLGSGSGAFTYASSITAGTNTVNLTSGDWNNDGKPDIAVVNFGSATISILMGNASGGFAVSQTVSVGVNPASIVSSDFNHDGWPDLAVANQGSNTVSILMNNGSGSFVLTTSLTGMSFVDIAQGSQYLAPGDFNGDGYVDLAIANVSGGGIRIYKGDGTGGFTLANSVPVGTAPHGVFAADINSDGKPDLISTNYSAGTSSVLLNLSPNSMVSSVNLVLPDMFTVSGGPITGAGTLTASFAAQPANRVFAAPVGTSGVPSFRSLTESDIPRLPTQVNQCLSFASGGNQPALCATVDSLENNTSIQNVNLLCGGALCPAGFYELKYYMELRSPASSGAVRFNCGWDDGTNAQTLSSNALSLESSSPGNFVSGQCVFYSGGVQNLGFSTTVEGVNGAPSYDVHATLIRIG